VDPFEVTEELLEDIRVVSVRGELTITTARGLGEPLERAARDRSRPLVIDLSGCTFVDSTGFATLLHGTKPLQNGEANLAVVCPAGDVRKLLELTGIDQTVPVFETRREAFAAVLSVE
jgi:anti-anti-sigma factor